MASGRKYVSVDILPVALMGVRKCKVLSAQGPKTD